MLRVDADHLLVISDYTGLDRGDPVLGGQYRRRVNAVGVEVTQ